MDTTAPQTNTTQQGPKIKGTLSPQLNDKELRENIDFMVGKGISKDQVQSYVDNYKKNSDGTYSLKGLSTPLNQPTDSTTPGGFLGKVADFIGGSKLAQGFGQTIANEGPNGVQTNLQNIQNESMDLQTQLLKRIKEDKDQGKDTSRLQAALDHLGMNVSNEGNASENVGTGGLSNKEVMGSSLQLAANAIPGAAKGASLDVKAATGAATGYAFDVSNKLQDENKTIGQDFTPGAGTVIGGAIPVVGAGLSYLSKNLPSWFIQKALPKLDSKNVDWATQTLDAGTVKSNLDKSTQAVRSSGDTLNSILNHPQYEKETGNVGQVVQDTLDKYPNAQLNNAKVASIVKNVTPAQKDLIDKVMNGTANIAEQNKLRQAIDQAVYPKFTDTPSLTFAKQVAKAFTDSLRGNVQNTAPETIPLFEQFSKELNLNQALKFAKAKIEKGAPVSLYDFAGAAAGGIPGIIGERVARTPAALISTAKGINAVNRVAQNPIVQDVGKVVKKVITQGAAKITR